LIRDPAGAEEKGEVAAMDEQSTAPIGEGLAVDRLIRDPLIRQELRKKGE